MWIGMHISEGNEEADDRRWKEEYALLGRRCARHGTSGWISGYSHFVFTQFGYRAGKTRII
jgi:hypothetical protein